jgi:type IV secretory pathway VirB2 component (pilin)
MGDPSNNDIEQSTAIANAAAEAGQQGVLADLETAQKIFTQNIAQQIVVSRQHALDMIQLAIVAKSVSLIDQARSDDNSDGLDQVVKEICKSFNELDELRNQSLKGL